MACNKGSFQPCFVVCRISLWHHFECTNTHHGFRHKYASSVWKCIFHTKIRLQLLFSKQFWLWLFDLQVKSPGNWKPGPENFPEPQNHICLMEEMPYAPALQRPCFASLCHCVLSGLCSAGSATTFSLQQELGKATGSGTSCVGFYMEGLREKPAQETNRKISKECLCW